MDELRVQRALGYLSTRFHSLNLSLVLLVSQTHCLSLNFLFSDFDAAGAGRSRAAETFSPHI